MESQKKVAALNTVRVFAAFTVILSHYAWLDQFANSQADIYFAFAGIGGLGVILFFAISGYLASNSLSRSKNILEFYRRKLIRIIIPFSTAYLVLGASFILLGIVEPSLVQRSPFFNFFYGDRNYLEMLLSLIPVDVTLIKHFDLQIYWFVGEWFVATIIYMYFIAPLLDKILRYNFFFALILSLTVSIAAFYYFSELGMITKNSTAFAIIFIVRIPEFLLGMAIFIYRDYIAKHRSAIKNFCLPILLTVTAYSLITVDNNQSITFWGKIFVADPRWFIVSLPIIYLFFDFAKWLNEKFSASLEKFNSFSDISYMAMLIQHVIIYLFADSFDLQKMSTFGIWFIFALIVLTVIFVSKKIHDIYKPIEEWCIKNFLVKK